MIWLFCRHFWLNIRNIENDEIVFDENSMIRAKAPDWEQKFGIQDEDTGKKG